MGLLCTVRIFAIRHLVACPALPLILYPARYCAVEFLSVPSLYRLSHSSVDSARNGSGELPSPTSGPARLQNTQLRTSAEMQTPLKDAPMPSSGISLPGRKEEGSESRRWLMDARGNRRDLFGDDGDRALSSQLLDLGKEDPSLTAGTFFGVTKEKLELRSQIVISLLLNILKLQDITLVGSILNDWLKKFASRVQIACFVDDLSGQGDRTEQQGAGRFVPYTQVARIVHAVMQDLGQRGHLEAALEVLRWMERQGWCQLDPHLYTTIIDSLGEAGSFELAEKIFESLDSRQVRKDTELCNAMLNARGKAGQIDSLEDLFESMKQSASKPDLVTYNTVMNCYVKAGMGLGTVVDVFSYMYSHRIDPDLVSFNILLQACISGKHMKEAQKIFENLKKRGLKPSVVTFTTLITLYANSGHYSEALELLNEMLRENCEPNTRTFSSLITACGRDGNIEEAERLFLAMRELGVEQNVVTYNAMIDMYGKGGDLEMAEQKYKELKLAGLKPTGVTIASLMSNLKAAGAYEEVITFYDYAKQKSICNEHVFAEAIDTFIKWGKLQRITGVQSDMAAVKCSPNVVTCSIVLAALRTQCNSAEDAALLVNFLRAFKAELPAESCRLLLERMGNDEEIVGNIHRLFLLLDKEEVRTWIVFSSAIVDALWALGWYRRAAQVVAWVMGRGLFGEMCVIQPQEWKLDLRRLSSGIALVVLYQWLGHLRFVALHLEDSPITDALDDGTSGQVSAVAEIGREIAGELLKESKKDALVHVEVLLPLLPALSGPLSPKALQSTAKSERGGSAVPLVTIVTGWGKLSKLEGSSVVQTSVQREILKLRAPFRPSADSGRWMTSSKLLVPWLLSSSTAVKLILSDLAAEVENVV